MIRKRREHVQLPALLSCITDIESIKTGNYLWGDDRLRKEKDIIVMPQAVKDMWEWYALTLVTATARKDWKWQSEEKRCGELFSDCETESWLCQCWR
jgi:hypothetical protein